MMRYEEYIPDLEFSKHPVNAMTAVRIMQFMDGLIRRGPSEWISLHSFVQKLWYAQVYFDESCYLAIIHESYHASGTVNVGKVDDDDMVTKARQLVDKIAYPDIPQIVEALGSDSYLFDKFTYVSRFTNNSLSFHHIQDVILDYLRRYVHPEMWRRNQSRVLAAIPTPPNYDIQKILNNIYVIESMSGIQGTCFHLANYGLVTCEHTVVDDSYVFKADDLKNKYPVKIFKKNEVIDLAIIQADGLALEDGLQIGDSDKVKLNDHMAVAGFPNHNYGDTGIFSPGLIVGFRMASSIRRMLVNTPLIGGNSGGPIIGEGNKVIGVAVTGADKMENAPLTENHGVIPISALNLL
ncbi:hypothetical protein GCM10011386_38270 [Parapedobacter defluvii]|uniref:Trypsin-like peptidase domain-containing protein n=1 Tax=Parapedobacter defluvii TaxID=2045106 RepID=A0ABQ1ML33_9SPHI|nr:serine protease [Parapedobacter defluvii]GGC42401.1 hypothetical protein GCM10011386_38270 [Parapedobacter defluvii]